MTTKNAVFWGFLSAKINQKPPSKIAIIIEIVRESGKVRV